MNDKITIIEGPTPTFERVGSDWADSICETSQHDHILLTNLRTMNGNALMERCRRTWAENDLMYLHFRTPLGLEARVPIIAAQLMETPDGQQLILWVRMADKDLSKGYIAGENED